MDFISFYNKLRPYFTPAQIGNFDREAVQSAVDGLLFDATHADFNAMKEAFKAGRELICTIIADYIESDPAFIEALAGSPITWEKRKALIMQLDNEW